MTFIIYAFPWYIRAINQIVGGRGVEGRGIGGRGGGFPFKRSSIVPDIFIVIFRVRNGRIGSILRQESQQCLLNVREK